MTLCSLEDALDTCTEAEDEALILAHDFDSPGTSSAVSCADLIAAVKKSKPVEVRGKSLTPCKFAEAVLKSPDDVKPLHK